MRGLFSEACVVFIVSNELPLAEGFTSTYLVLLLLVATLPTSEGLLTCVGATKDKGR